MSEIVVKKPRIDYFDFLRGISMILIVAVHTYPFSGDGFSALLKQFSTIGTSLFLFISGYFLYKKDVSTLDKYFSFLKNRFLKIQLPMIVCSIFILLIAFFDGSKVNWINVLIFLPFGGCSIYYFVALIMQCYILLPIFKRILNWQFVIFSLLLGIFSYYILCYCIYNNGYDLNLFLARGPFFVRFFPFIAGLYFRKYEDNFISKKSDSAFMTLLFSKKLLFLLGLIFLVCAYVEFVVVYEDTGKQASLGYSPFLPLYYFFFSFFIIQLKPYYKANILFDKVVKVGNVSFAIYLMHMIVINRILDLQNYINVSFYSDLNWFFRTLVVLFLTYFIIKILQFVFPKKITSLVGI